MGRTTPLCPQCQEVGPDTVIEHSTLGLIQYETCRDCTFHNLSRTSSQGQFVMSCYATQDELNRDRYALHYLTCVRDMKYQMYQISTAYPRYTLTRRAPVHTLLGWTSAAVFVPVTPSCISHLRLATLAGSASCDCSPQGGPYETHRLSFAHI